MRIGWKMKMSIGVGNVSLGVNRVIKSGNHHE